MTRLHFNTYEASGENFGEFPEEPFDSLEVCVGVEEL